MSFPLFKPGMRWTVTQRAGTYSTGERFPDAEFTFVSQVDTMIVKPADD